MPTINTADLIDSTDVASLIGVTSPKAVSVYRSRYDDFPEPVVEKGSGRCVLWRRQDVEAWVKARGRG